MLAVHCNTKVTLDKIAIKYDYQPPPPQQTSKSKGWFGGLFSRSSSNVEEEAKKEPNPDSNHFHYKLIRHDEIVSYYLGNDKL